MVKDRTPKLSEGKNPASLEVSPPDEDFQAVSNVIGSLDKELDFWEDSPPTKEELQAAKEVINSFLVAMKNYALYPEHHAVYQKCLENAVGRLNKFLTNYGDLRLDIEKNRLLLRGKTVYQESSEGEDLAFLLFRDGIQWLQFQNGIQDQEITGFFKILNQYGKSQEEAEGDLVTALWEANFAHLKYEIGDLLWEAETVIDFSHLKVADEKEHNPVQAGGEAKEELHETSLSIAAPDIDTTLWKLTPKEMISLHEMVLEEEKQDKLEDMLDVILIILKELCEPKDFVPVLEFLEQEFQYTLSQRQFHLSLKLLKELHRIRLSCKTEKPEVIPFFEHFFMVISSPQTLDLLNQVWPVLDILESDRMETLRQVLLLLPAEAILALGPMLLQTSSVRIQRQIMEIIGSLAIRNIQPLEQLLNQAEDNLAQKLIYILRHLKSERSTQILRKMINHPSERVRVESLKALVFRDPKTIENLFPLIEDTSETIRWLMLRYLGRHRSESSEDLLLKYLEQQRYKIKERQHLLACYRALGQCGSQRSLPFLRKALLDQGWLPGPERSTHRQGAAMALMTLETEEAEKILEKASRSLFPSIRIAYHRAMEKKRW